MKDKLLLMPGDYVQVQGQVKKWAGPSYDDDVQPVELTEDILVESGFKADHNLGSGTTTPYIRYMAYKYNFGLVLKNNVWSVWQEGRITLKYVHELQHILRVYHLDDLAACLIPV